MSSPEESTFQKNPWDEHAEEFARFVARREESNPADDPLISRMLDLLGELNNRSVLDACCGEGFFSRILASRRAKVAGIDISARLIDMARAKDPDKSIDYRVGDLSQAIPELENTFDLVASHLALNDVADHRGFAETVASVAKAGARLVLGFNNPYSLVVRGHITDYFDSDAKGMYRGLAEQGIRAHYYHRTLEEYVGAFIEAGLRLTALADVEPHRVARDWFLPEGHTFPLFMILAFVKPG